MYKFLLAITTLSMLTNVYAVSFQINPPNSSFGESSLNNKIQKRGYSPAETFDDLVLFKKYIEENAPLDAIAKMTNYQKWVNKGLLKAGLMSQLVNNQQQFYSTLNYYINGFTDFHTAFGSIPEMTDYRYAGFIVNLRYNNHHQLVYKVVNSSTSSSNKLPPVGSELLSCNGFPVDNLIKSNVLPFYYTSKVKNITWNNVVPYLFLAQKGNQIVYGFKKITMCRFRVGKVIKNYHIHWHTPSVTELNKLISLANQSANGMSPDDFAIQYLANDIALVSLQTFQISNKVELKSYERLVSQLPKIRNMKKIIFDLRGNDGGFPQYVNQVILSLWTPQYLKSLGCKFIWNDNFSMQFKVTQNNFNALKQMGLNEPRLISEMSLALKNQQSYLNYRFNILPSTVKPNNKNPVKAKVYVLTDSTNASGALWFIQVALEVPNTIQIGQTTRVFDATGFPSTLIISAKGVKFGAQVPMAVISSPTQNLNKPFVPNKQFYYYNYLGDNKSLEQWIQQL